MPTPGTIAIIILVVLILAVVVSCIQIVQQSKAYVIERLGAFHSVWGVGMHFKLPFIERVVKKVSLKEQVADFDPQPVITKDNVTMQIDTVIYFQITDPKLYTYGVEYPMSAIENLTATTLRNIIGELELDQSLTSRDTINAKMRSILDEATDPWGIKVNRVELKNILPPREIQNAMEKQMKAERERRESILQAEGEKASKVLIAEGEKQSVLLQADAAKQAKIMAAEAEATSILKVQQALAASPASPCNSLGMMILVALPSATLVMASRAFSFTTWSLGAASFSSFRASAVACWTFIMASLSASAARILAVFSASASMILACLAASARRIADCFSPSATRIWLCFWPSA